MDELLFALSQLLGAVCVLAGLAVFLSAGWPRKGA